MKATQQHRPDFCAIENRMLRNVASLARPAGIEPATPGLEDGANKLLKREDLRGAARLLVATFAAP